MIKKRLLIGTTALLISSMLFSLNIFAINKNATNILYENHSNVLGTPTSSSSSNIKNRVDEKENNAMLLPNTESFQKNEDFKEYDPAYPKKEQFGDYVLQIPELKERLTFSTSKDNQIVGTLYAPGISQQGGWKDATKKWGKYDFGLCFAASSSNLISWYLNRYTQLHPEDHNAYIMNEERVFDRFRNGWDPALGGNQTEALSWYFTGGFPSGNSQAQDNQLTGNEQGGYLRNKIYNNKSNRWADVSISWNPREKFTVFGGYDDNKFPFIEEVGGMSKGGAFSNLRGFSDQILRQLHYGACTISILTDQSSGGSGHAITVWGADYDVNTGLVTAIHVTDSDDNRGGFTVPIQKGDDNSEVRMINYPYHPPFGNPQNFTRIRDSIVLYAPEVVKPINKPTLNAKVEGQKRIDLDKKDAQVFKLKTTGHELSYVPEYQIEFKNEKGIKLPADQISTKYDIFNREFTVIIKNEKIVPGNYTAEITEKYTKQKFVESFEFYKENQTYTVTFHANEGNGVMDVQQFEMDVEQALLSNQFSKIGYTFKGWSKQPNGEVEFKDSQAVTNLSTGKDTNVDLYAVWAANAYTITFHSAGGTGEMSSQPLIYDQSFSLSKNTFTKEGYTFKGWSKQPNGEVEFKDSQAVTNLSTGKDTNVDLYAVWAANAYTITFHSAGGTGEMSSQPLIYDQSFSLSKNTFTKEGYTFKGWSKQPNGEVEFKDSQAVTNLSTGKDTNVDLYAVWAANAYTITFHSAGGTGEMSSQPMIYDQSSPLSKNTFTKEGYTFKGWSTVDNGTVIYLDEADVINLTNKADGQIVLYAIWEENVIDHQFGYKINVTDQVITIGENFDPLNIIDVYDENNEKVMLDQSNIIENTVDLNVSGIYHITYQITDKKGITITKTIQVTVKDDKPLQPSIPEKPEKPEKPDNHVQPNELLKPDKEKKTPNTDDGFNISLISTMLIGSIGVITIILNKKRYQ
ncbi:IdeS/Mac family cysteine endopeptidase [Faecalimonas sp.]